MPNKIIINERKLHVGKKLAGEKAAEYVQNGMTVGLGTGSTVYYTINKLGEMVKNGLSIRVVSTSTSTTKLAESLGIPMFSINEVDKIDITIDGADEVDLSFDGIKGGGGALFFEKIVAVASDKIIWVVDSQKQVKKIGSFPLPIEVLPFGYLQVFSKLKAAGLSLILRQKEEKLFVTDSGNYIIDLRMGIIENPKELELWLNSITGVVEHGLFINMVDLVIVGKDGTTQTIQNNTK